MKKNYTLKVILAMLVIVLVSLVSFVGVYKGKNLVREYSLGQDFESKKVAIFYVEETEEDTSDEEVADETTEEESSDEEVVDETTEKDTSDEEVAEETTEEESSDEEVAEETAEEESSDEEVEEETTEEESSDEETTDEETEEVDITEQYKNAKKVIENRLSAINIGEYNIRLNENDGTLVIEVPTDMNSSYIEEIVTTGEAQIINSNTSEVIVDSDGFKDASATLDTTTYSEPMVLLSIEFTSDAKEALKNASTDYAATADEESDDTFSFPKSDLLIETTYYEKTDATFALTIDGESLYSDTASDFVTTAKNGSLDLVLGQGDTGEDLEEDYESALILTSLIKYGQVDVEFTLDSVQIVSSGMSIQNIIIFACVIGLILLIFAIIKFKGKAILPVISLVGLVATILLVIRYTNVQMTLYTILGIAIIVITNYILILKSLKSDKKFMHDLMKTLEVFIPCIIIAIVFCCTPYLQLTTLGMTIFWGTIVMFIYNALITRILIDK